MSDLVPIKRALISVSDKTGLDELGQALAKYGIEILSTGGTAAKLRETGLSVKDVAEHTGFPEMMDGRVKTLHPLIHGGLLALRDNPKHKAAMQEHNIGAIDLVVVNLYPFEATVESGADRATIIENIDIGGPSMVRSAAKNHRFVTILTDAADYADFLEELEKNNGSTSLSLRTKLARKAYERTARYDAAINQWFQKTESCDLPEALLTGAPKIQTLRYGENPHQRAALYKSQDDKRPGVASAEKIQGKELSYNNLNDTDAAFELVSEFDTQTPAIAIIKHANPCGVALGKSLKDAYQKALKCDPVSAFGGIIAANQKLTGEVAEEIAKIFTEVIIAPDADDDARRIFAKKKNLRLLLTGTMPDPGEEGLLIKSIAGGYLVQDRDAGHVDASDLKVVTKKQPSQQEMDDLLFAFTVAKHVKSNTIVYARNGATVGIGAGQMSRVDAARIAARKAEDAAKEAGEKASLTKGSVAASDAFFPFADGLLVTAEAGATAVIQPGGSMRDDEVIAAADEAGLSMVMTGMRHFRH